MAFTVHGSTIPELERRIRETMRTLGVEDWSYEYAAHAAVARADGSVSLLSADVAARA